MRRAFIHLIEYICGLWWRRNPSLTETSMLKARVVRLLMWDSWNQKFLDYEIETSSPCRRRTLTPYVEIKSFSITRLKPCSGSVVCIFAKPSWNQKFLDYEIETCTHCPNSPLFWLIVEIKSFSITRLKRTQPPRTHHPWPKLKSKVSRLRDWNERFMPLWAIAVFCWNQKFLDYEIETSRINGIAVHGSTRWNQKFLDYEIETR